MPYDMPLAEAGKNSSDDKKSDTSGLSVAEITCAEELQSKMHGKPSEFAKALKAAFKVFGKR